MGVLSGPPLALQHTPQSKTDPEASPARRLRIPWSSSTSHVGNLQIAFKQYILTCGKLKSLHDNDRQDV